jgi:hypothetical protein
MLVKRRGSPRRSISEPRSGLCAPRRSSPRLASQVVRDREGRRLELELGGTRRTTHRRSASAPCASLCPPHGIPGLSPWRLWPRMGNTGTSSLLRSRREPFLPNASCQGPETSRGQRQEILRPSSRRPLRRQYRPACASRRPLRGRDPIPSQARNPPAPSPPRPGNRR